MESVNILRLKSGEDIICYMEHYGHDEIVVRDAMVVFTKTDFKSGKQIIMLEHWLPIQLIKENETIIKQSEVVATMTPSSDFFEYYMNAVSVVKESLSLSEGDELSSSSDDELTPEDMRLILDAVGTTNQMH
jgi:hypothetical protein